MAESKTPLTRIDAEKSSELYEASYYELQELDEKIKQEKKQIDEDNKVQRESLLSEMQEHEKVLKDYTLQTKSETTQMPSGVSFGNYAKESYEVDEAKDTVNVLDAFKDAFPTNYKNFLTGYPKFSKTKMDNLIENGFITTTDLAIIGINKTTVSEFQVKVPKKKG